eukprot:CAMPEP_0183300334 /NCGR_PEP_ID=MMETSP0160_2-20130417/6799_1 /TAXON_ID=2839 ORGANISM="Odontella Sinensis, Strain Grunow 1884" /NCGR_SAMPLE_ID=MMETSP0160_2 /ASSEMBLY_ACC=CAM_ASM_000250 /LENGTH=72 /DNA_ID=CAMNT_0025462731 /DNA_START=17 /DNA_END=232 /DNA_ORIENTATION=-
MTNYAQKVPIEEPVHQKIIDPMCLSATSLDKPKLIVHSPDEDDNTAFFNKGFAVVDGLITLADPAIVRTQQQ